MNVVPVKSLFNHLLSLFGKSPMPTFVSVEPSSVCQLHCPQCPCGIKGKSTGTGAFMSLSTYKKILTECRGWVHTFQFYFQGEPLLNPYLSEMIHLAHQAHIYTTCSTNAQALTPLLAQQLIQAGLNRIIVSIDGLSEESYQAYRQGGSLNQALKGLVYLRQAKERIGGYTHIELQCLRLKSNEHEWALFQRSYRQMGADSLTLKSAQFYDYEHGDPLMPSNEADSRYHRQEDGTFIPKNRLHAMNNIPCKRIQKGCVITVNGDVLPCCFDKASQFIMGNIHQSSLRAIWQGGTFCAFRQTVKHNRTDYAICNNCTEG